MGAEYRCGVHDAPPGYAWKHCHEKYVWTPVCLTTSLHHGLVWSYHPFSPFPKPGVSRPGGGYVKSGKAGAVKAARAPSVSEGSLDRRSQPGRYSFIKPGRVSRFFPGVAHGCFDNTHMRVGSLFASYLYLTSRPEVYLPCPLHRLHNFLCGQEGCEAKVPVTACTGHGD